MVRLNPYENQQGIGIGGVVRSGTQDASARALSNLGGAIGNFADARGDVEARVTAEGRARSSNLDNLRLQSELMAHEDRVRKFALEQEANMLGEGSSGQGYEASVAAFAANDAKATVRQKFANREDQEALDFRFASVSRNVVSRAAEMEINTGLRYQGAVSDKTVAGLSTKIAENPDSYDSAAAEWVAFATSTNVGRPKLQERMTAIGLAKLQRARLEAVAARDPVAFREAASGAFTDTPVADAPPDVKAVVNGATDHGIDPRTLLGIYEIESGMNPNAGSPIGRDGRPMSSAKGGFQVLSAADTLNELGITAEQRNDNSVVAPALAAYLKRKTDEMAAKGIPVTPGKQYMFWNMGPGVAMATIQADPNTPIEAVINRVLANRSPEFRAQFLANNPSLYKSGMTAGQVVANYDARVARAAAVADKKVANTDLTTDEQAKAFFEKLFPGGAPLLGAQDIGEVQLLARSKTAELSREQQNLNLGAAIITGEAKVDPRDTRNQKAVNEVVLKNGMAAGLAEGDPEAHRRAQQITNASGFAPAAFVNAYSAALAGGDMKGRVAAYVALSDLQAQNPGAFDATKMPSDDRSRIREYVALTTVSNLSPNDAIARIDFARSPEGKKQADAQRAGLQTTRTAEVKGLTSQEVIDRFDAPWSMSAPTDTEGRFIAAATAAYREQYVFYRESGKGAEEAKAMALADLDQNWGSSRVADTGRGANTQTFMPYPPEKLYRPNDQGHQWITDQARNAAVSFVEERYPAMAKDYQAGLFTSGLKDAIGIKLVPDIQTAHERRANKPAGYRLLVRLPDGNHDVSTQRFYPDQAQADREAVDRFKAGQPSAREEIYNPRSKSMGGMAASP